MKNLAAIERFLIITAMTFLVLLLPPSAVSGQEPSNVAQDDDILQIHTTLGQISVAIEQTTPEPFRVEVSDNGAPVANVNLQAPTKDNPLQVMIIVAMNPVDKWKTSKDELIYQIKQLDQNPGIRLAGINIIEDDQGFCNKLKFPKSLSTERFADLDSAVDRSVRRLSQTKGDRKAVLVLTNEVESLPVDVIERTNNLLGQSSLMVYLMSVNEKGLKAFNKKSRVKGKTISRTNINGQDIVVFPRNFLGGLFRSFTRLASNLYTVSYDLPEATVHQVEAVVKRVRDNVEIARNIRRFKTLPATDGATYLKAAFRPKTGTDEEISVKGIADSNFDALLTRRAAKLTVPEIDYYERELRRRPELSGTEILSSDHPLLQNLRANLQSLVRIYDRADYTRLFVYRGDQPFIGLYRECILIFSTKALELLTAEETRAAVAHEFAHEVFIAEMRAADQADDDQLRRIVEHKCDLVAVMATAQLGDDPYSVVTADALFTNWYRENPSAADIGANRSPSNAERRDWIKTYLKLAGKPLTV